MRYLKNKGFALLEVMLAVIAVMIVGIGVYSVFSSGVNNNDLTAAATEMVEVANIYTDLASADLTANVDETSIVTLLQNSGRLSSSYFGSDEDSDGELEPKMFNKFGELNFLSADSYSFVVDVPLGSREAPVDQFCKQLQDSYSNCVATPDVTDTASAMLRFDLSQ